MKKPHSTTMQTLQIFLQANLRYKRHFFTTLTAWTTGLMLQNLGLPLIAAQAINQLIVQSSTSIPIVWQNYTPYIVLFVVIAIVAQILIDIGLLTLAKLESYARPTLQARIFDMLIHQSLRFHANNFSGALVSQVNKFTTAYLSLTDALILQIIHLVVNVLLAIAIIAYFSPVIAAALCIWTILFIGLNIYLTKRRMHLSRRASEADSILTGHLADSISNVAAIKSFGNEEHEAETHSTKTADRTAKKYASWLKAVQNDAVFGLLMSFLRLLVLVLSIHGVMNNTIGVTTLLLVQVYIAQIIGQLWGLSSLSRNVEQSLSDAGEMTELLEESFAVADPPQPKAFKVTAGAIHFERIAFAHDGEDDALFHDFDLDIKPGEKVGLVGHSGSGKTSLTKLLLRFADIDGGQIRIDGQDIRSVAQTDLRSQIAYVPQEPLLFHRSIRDNISYGRLHATENQVINAAHRARAIEFIDKLPKGYDTMVGERGVKLSGGQRQRIAIARAIIKDAPILILDEATSALDSESEKYIQEALGELMQRRTVIVIAHRLSTIQKMDRIVVLEDGGIIEQGSHSQLLRQRGTYATLWSHQSGSFIEE